MIKQRVTELTALRGVSGHEDAVREYILRAVEGHCEGCSVDNLGNVIVTKKGLATPSKKLVLSAHMDEVGFIITGADDDGLLRFASIGGIMPAVAMARPVLVGNRGLNGVIGAKPVHMLNDDEKEKYPPLEDMRIDIGATDKASARALVSPGEMATFVSPMRELGGGCFCVRAIDDRGGCALLLELICGETLTHDCTFVFTVQEETGCVGACAAAFAVAADIAVAVEGTTASDIPGAAGAKRVCAVGGGPVISFADSGTLYDYGLYTVATQAAEEGGIPWQTKELVAGGNESRSYQSTGVGSRVLAVSMPVRYIHSATSVASWGDIDNTLLLLRLLIGKLPV